LQILVRVTWFSIFLYCYHFLCNRRSVFKTRAAKIEKALKEKGYTITINPTKPRKGCFVIKKEGKEKPVVELLSLPRPFTKLRELDLEEVIDKILA
jgi:hypothetical protein